MPEFDPDLVLELEIRLRVADFFRIGLADLLLAEILAELLAELFIGLLAKLKLRALTPVSSVDNNT